MNNYIFLFFIDKETKKSVTFVKKSEKKVSTEKSVNYELPTKNRMLREKTKIL